MRCMRGAPGESRVLTLATCKVFILLRKIRVIPKLGTTLRHLKGMMPPRQYGD